LSLAGWVVNVLGARYRPAVRKLHPCRYEHPEVVDQLSALRAMWRLANEDGSAPPALATDRLDRHLPNVVRRFDESLTSYLSWRSCGGATVPGRLR
jgi:hypothetical protein